MKNKCIRDDLSLTLLVRETREKQLNQFGSIICMENEKIRRVIET